MRKTDIYGEVVKSPTFKQGQKVGFDDLLAAIDRVYDKRYPVVPNAKKKTVGSTKNTKAGRK